MVNSPLLYTPWWADTPGVDGGGTVSFGISKLIGPSSTSSSLVLLDSLVYGWNLSSALRIEMLKGSSKAFLAANVLNVVPYSAIKRKKNCRFVLVQF